MKLSVFVFLVNLLLLGYVVFLQLHIRLLFYILIYLNIPRAVITLGRVRSSSDKMLIAARCCVVAKIGIFYLVFYSSLAAFFAIMLAGFFSTIDGRRPTQTGLTSLIKLNPGQR